MKLNCRLIADSKEVRRGYEANCPLRRDTKKAICKERQMTIQPMERFDVELEKLAYDVIGAAIKVHKALGPGHPEKVYANALEIEFQIRDIPYAREYEYDIIYESVVVGKGRMDFLVGSRLAVELKAVEKLAPYYWEQTKGYLINQQEPLGLLINFWVDMLKKGINRVVEKRFGKQSLGCSSYFFVKIFSFVYPSYFFE